MYGFSFALFDCTLTSGRPSLQLDGLTDPESVIDVPILILEEVIAYFVLILGFPLLQSATKATMLR